MESGAPGSPIFVGTQPGLTAFEHTSGHLRATAVLSTTTHFLLKNYKNDGDILEEPDAPERLPVTP